MNAPHVNVPAAAADRKETIAERLARYVARFRYEDIPQATRERAKLLILDAVGIALASTHYDFAHRALSGLRALDEGGGSSLINLPGKLALRDAVLMNGVLVHGLDYDDTHIRAIVTQRPARSRAHWVLPSRRTRREARCSRRTCSDRNRNAHFGCRRRPLP